MDLASKAEQPVMAADATENANFVALVIGYKGDLERLHKRICEPLGLKGIHMRRLARKMQERVLEKLDHLSPSPAAVQAHCLEIDFESQRDLAEKERPTPYYPKGRLLEVVNRSAMEEIKRAVQSSLETFGITRNWSMLTIEVDSDTERMIMTTGAKTTTPGVAHQLADAVAWSNHARIRVKCISHSDLVTNVTARVRKAVRR
jgi:hypothetical protein